MSRTLVALGMLSTLSACTALPAYGGRELLMMPVTVQSLRGFDLARPDIVVGSSGPYLHSRLCRKARNYDPSSKHLKVVISGPDGLITSQRNSAPHLGVIRGARCKNFDIPLNAVAVKYSTGINLVLEH